MKQIRIYSMRHEPRIKFGVRIPKDYGEAVEFDSKNENKLWQEDTNIEMDQISRLVAGEHLTGPNMDVFNSNVVLLR